MESRALFFRPEICRVVSTKCIPLARNALVRSGYASDDRFWQELQDQGVFLGNSMFLCSADAKVMAGFKDRDLAKWLASWDALPRSERAPGAVKIEQRGEYREEPRNPRMPAGTMVLKTYMRALDQDAEGKLFAPGKLSLGICKTVIKSEPNRDFFWITKRESDSLVPAKLQPGETVAVSASIRDRICRFHLVDGACCLPGFWQPKDVRSGALTLSVGKVLASEVQMDLTGFAKVGAKDPFLEFNLAGALTYNLARKVFTRFDVVARSARPCHRDTATGKLLTLGVAFELADPMSPSERRPPFRIWYDGYGSKDYFGVQR